ncbi:MAG: hypothetical protein H6Q45_890 [Deltaproteobacteria bacterium]|nr:hypothetical protein [Deltaproteobacteria bacterium]
MKHKVFSVDTERCIACRACAAACAREHGGIAHIFITAADGGQSLPLCCMHCEKSPCVESCPTAALERVSHGAVIAHQTRCIGCGMCIIACPFGVISLEEEQGVQKCDRCIHRLNRGREPVCVLTCPTNALVYDAPGTMASRRRTTYALKAKKK